LRADDAPYAAGALTLAAEAAIHLQQFTAEFHAVRWIGPLFVVNAVACLAAAAGLAHRHTRPLAAFAGIVISAMALGGLVLSYGPGLLGWQEGGWRTAVELAVISEVAATLTLAGGLALGARTSRHEGASRPDPPRSISSRRFPWTTFTAR
jgi:hypothetical protein